MNWQRFFPLQCSDKCELKRKYCMWLSSLISERFYQGILFLLLVCNIKLVAKEIDQNGKQKKIDETRKSTTETKYIAYIIIRFLYLKGLPILNLSRHTQGKHIHRYWYHCKHTQSIYVSVSYYTSLGHAALVWLTVIVCILYY